MATGWPERKEMKHTPVIPVNRRSNLPITEPPEIRFDVMIVLDKCFIDEDGDVVDDKTIEHEVLGSFETEDEARELIVSLENKPPKPTVTEGPPFDSVECEVKTGKDWLLTYWWWKDKSWWIAEKLWKAIVEPVVIEYLRNNDPEKADDPLYLDGLMAEFDFKGLDEKLIELLEFADEEQERNAGLTKVEGE